MHPILDTTRSQATSHRKFCFQEFAMNCCGRACNENNSVILFCVNCLPFILFFKITPSMFFQYFLLNATYLDNYLNHTVAFILHTYNMSTSEGISTLTIGISGSSVIGRDSILLLFERMSDFNP